MKVAILQEEAKAVLAKVKPALAGKTTLPILSNVLLQATDGMTITANNFELAITCPAMAKVEQPGETTVPGKLFADLINKMPPERIDLELSQDGNRLHVNCAGYETELNTISASEFPVPQTEGFDSRWFLDPEQFKILVTKTAFAAATDEARPVFTGVFLEIENNGIVLAAADGFRLSKVSMNGQSDLAPGKFIIPVKALNEVQKLIDDETETLVMSSNGRQVLFDVDGVQVVTQLLEGEFPDYNRIIPLGHTTTAIVDSATIKRALEVNNLFAREGAGLVKLGFDPDRGAIHIESTSAESGGSNVDLSASVEGDPLEIAFNVQYMLDAINVMDFQVTFQGSTSSSPGVFKNGLDDDFIHVIMPMHIQKKLGE